MKRYHKFRFKSISIKGIGIVGIECTPSACANLLFLKYRLRLLKIEIHIRKNVTLYTVERYKLDTRRTRPWFLSEGEAETEKRRTEEMVRGFCRWKKVKRIGETNNFFVDFDSSDRLLLVYGKETPIECPFKLAFDESEATAIIDLLAKARAFFHGH